MPNVPYSYEVDVKVTSEVNWQLVTGNGSLTPICSLSKRSSSPSLTLLYYYYFIFSKRGTPISIYYYIIVFFRFSKQDINNRVASFRTLLLRQPYNPSIRENNNGSDER